MKRNRVPRVPPNRAVLKAARLLEAVADAGVPVRLSELSRRTGIPKPTALRLLAALTAAGLVARVPGSSGGGYRLGARVLYLAGRVNHGDSLVIHARPILQRLRDATGETVGIYRREGQQVVCVECLVSEHAVRLHMQPGAVGPLHAGASARLLLAHADPDEVEAVLAGPLEPFTENTLVDPDVLRGELERIRREGYSVSFGELVPHTAAVSVPVRDRTGRVAAALSAAGPDVRIREHLTGIRDVLLAAGRELSRQLGYQEGGAQAW